MSDVLTDLEARINDAQAALAPLIAAESAAISTAAAATKARVAQEIQVGAMTAAHVAAKARLLGSNALTAVEGEAGKVVTDVKADVTSWSKWLISHSWVGAIAGVAGYGVKWLGWL